MSKARTKRADYAIAITSTGKGPWYDWLDSDEGKAASNPESLTPLTSSTRHYLENRLWRAFTAGMKEGYEQAKVKS